jgi:hypothetical protein
VRVPFGRARNNWVPCGQVKERSMKDEARVGVVGDWGGDLRVRKWEGFKVLRQELLA